MAAGIDSMIPASRSKPGRDQSPKDRLQRSPALGPLAFKQLRN
jgi:hypothetical protein